MGAFIKYLTARDKTEAGRSEKMISALTDVSKAMTTMAHEVSSASHAMEEKARALEGSNRELIRLHADPTSMFSTHGLREKLDDIHDDVKRKAAQA